MRNSTALMSIIVMSLCAMALAVPLAAGDESPESFSIYTEKAEYFVGDVVNIFVKADVLDSNQKIIVANVVVYDSLNASVAEWEGLSIVLTDTTTPIYVGRIAARSEGSYTVSAEATTQLLASSSVLAGTNGRLWILRAIWRFIIRYFCPNIVPEVPFGTIVATMSLAGAVGLYVVRKPKKIE